MSDENVIETSENGRYRVRLEIQQDSGSYNPRTEQDNVAHVVTVPTPGYIDVDKDGGPLADGWARLDGWSKGERVELFTRWARVYHDAVIVLDQPCRRGRTHEGTTALWYMLPEDIEREQIDRERAQKVIEGEIEEYRLWAAGEVYGWIIEKGVTWVRKGDAETTDGPDEMDTWEHVASCWGHIGRRWAEEAARIEFAHYRNAK